MIEPATNHELHLIFHPVGRFVYCETNTRVHRIMQGEGLVVSCNFEPSFFDLGTNPPHGHLMEDEANDIAEVFRLRSIGGTRLASKEF